MIIRRAKKNDSKGILELLSEVLEVHAALRADFFVSGTTKYKEDELYEIIEDDSRPIFVAVDENDRVLGYAFCVKERQPKADNLVPFSYMYIDDLCVDEKERGKHIASELFEFVKRQAKNEGMREIQLNVWEGNDSARRFYENAGFKPLKTVMEYKLV